MKKFIVTIDNSKKAAARTWARQMFGVSKPAGTRYHQMRWYVRDVYKNRDTWDLDSRFYFKDEADMAWFSMRWL